MHAQEVTFVKLVQGEKQFQVPLYQRTYSWGLKELKQLWEDVRELVDAQLEGETPASHFIGSVVLAPGQLAAAGVQRWLVVDGQQRLTTLMLAFAALRDELREVDGSEFARTAEKIQNLHLVNQYEDGNDHYRLLPTQADRHEFIACLDGSPQAGGGGNVGGAYRFFRGVFATGAEEHGAPWLEAVVSTMGHLLAIVEITTDPQDNVFRIFESINNTGVGLSQSDLLRNYVFMLLPSSGERVYQQVWLPMQQQLGPKNLELLVWLDLVVRGNSKAKQTEIYRDQQKRLQAFVNDEVGLRAEITALAERGRRLMRIVEPANEPDPGLRNALERLNRWGGQVHYPLALLLLERVDSGEATREEGVKAFGHVESYLVRRLLCQTATQGLNRLFMEMPKDLDPALPVDEAVRRQLSFRKSGPRVWPSDADVVDAVLRKPFYTAGRPVQRTFVLRSLEESYGAAEQVDYDKSNLTVEHVLPQKPSQQWFDEVLLDDVEDGQSPQELHELLVHTLGNLTLTGENSRLSNHPFHRKQEIFESSALRMNAEIARTPRWGAKEILARGEDLARRAVELWPGPINAAETAPEEWAGWKELHAALLAIPVGSWTTYGALAALIGSHPVPVGAHLATRGGLHGAHRVLTSDGRVSPSFRWTDNERDDDPRELLEQEGVPFDAKGRANPAYRLSADDLAALLDKELGSEAVEFAPTDARTRERAARFEELLNQNQPHAAEGVLQILRYWEQLSPQCRLDYGRAAETSAFPMMDTAPGTNIATTIWPLALYPVAGVVEVVFQHLRLRPPFDETALRKELMDRLNAVDGIELPEAKLELRPAFPLDVLARHRQEIEGILEWFCHTVTLHKAQQDQ